MRILASATDYIESWLDGDAERMARCLHPDLVKRESLEADPTAETMTRDDMIQATGRGSGRKLDRPYLVTILDACGDIATVSVLSSRASPRSCRASAEPSAIPTSSANGQARPVNGLTIPIETATRACTPTRSGANVVITPEGMGGAFITGSVFCGWQSARPAFAYRSTRHSSRRLPNSATTDSWITGLPRTRILPPPQTCWRFA